MKTDADLIRELGTDAAVAALVSPMLRDGISHEGIRKWREQGIPWRHRPMMYRLFKSKRLTPPDDFIEARRVA